MGAPLSPASPTLTTILAADALASRSVGVLQSKTDGIVSVPDMVPQSYPCGAKPATMRMRTLTVPPSGSLVSAVAGMWMRPGASTCP